MQRFLILSAVLAAVGVGSIVSLGAQQSQDSGPSPWSPWRSVASLANGARNDGGRNDGRLAAPPLRHDGGNSEAYRSLTNPLPRTEKTVERGASVYQQNCASCHGATGEGDGPASRGLNPPPANLAWLSQMPMVEWDPFMYWSVAEGGAPLGTAMPAYKGVLSKNDVWAVIAYIRAQLPQRAGRK